MKQLFLKLNFHQHLQNLIIHLHILERLDTAKKELAEQEKFTLTLVNDEVNACAEKLYGIIRQRAGLDK